MRPTTESDAADDDSSAAIEVDLTRDILSTDLAFDVSTLEATATLDVATSPSASASLEIGDLTIASVTDGEAELPWEIQETVNGAGVAITLLNVAVTPDEPVHLVVDYTVAGHENFDGWMPTEQLTFLWPTFCGNLFPCHSDPADGLTFTLEITGVAEGLTAVYPSTIPGDAPSYMPAVAIDQYQQVDLGTTTAGTHVSLWATDNVLNDALAGTALLKDGFDFYETTYGPYSFGDDVGSVSANWGGGDYGGMEHHPYWHVSSGSMYDPETHLHEAAHGWYGDGVRIACWEDFVLSEGTATYVSLHALELAGIDNWPYYEGEYLEGVCSDDQNTIALPDTCGEIDLVNDPLWSFVPYVKGALFYRRVAALIGDDALDEVLAQFYLDHVGGAARMQDMIDALERWSPDSADEIDALADAWLKQLDCPTE